MNLIVLLQLLLDYYLFLNEINKTRRDLFIHSRVTHESEFIVVSLRRISSLADFYLQISGGNAQVRDLGALSRANRIGDRFRQRSGFYVTRCKRQAGRRLFIDEGNAENDGALLHAAKVHTYNATRLECVLSRSMLARYVMGFSPSRDKPAADRIGVLSKRLSVAARTRRSLQLAHRKYHTRRVFA